jgi:5'-nucleotidase
MIIAVDIDDVCADLLTEWLRRYRKLSGHELHPRDVTSWNVTAQMLPEHREAGYKVLFDDDLYDGVWPHLGSKGAVQDLRELGRVIFVTSCPNMKAAHHKFEWLERNGFEPTMDNFFVAKDKSIIRADVLFDDGVHNCEAFGGPAYLVSRPHNKNVVWSGKRVNGLHEAPGIVSSLLEGK